MSLPSYLSKKGYQKKKMKLTKTNHFKISAKINGIKGKFIVDTGASNTCINKGLTEQFKLISEDSETKAAGAGATGMETQIAKNNSLKIGKWTSKKNSIVVFDLSHVNEALIIHGSKPVDGIIGADILKKGSSYNRL